MRKYLAHLCSTSPHWVQGPYSDTACGITAWGRWKECPTWLPQTFKTIIDATSPWSIIHEASQCNSGTYSFPLLVVDSFYRTWQNEQCQMRCHIKHNRKCCFQARFRRKQESNIKKCVKHFLQLEQRCKMVKLHCLKNPNLLPVLRRYCDAHHAVVEAFFLKLCSPSCPSFHPCVLDEIRFLILAYGRNLKIFWNQFHSASSLACSLLSHFILWILIFWNSRYFCFSSCTASWLKQQRITMCSALSFNQHM